MDEQKKTEHEVDLTKARIYVAMPAYGPIDPRVAMCLSRTTGSLEKSGLPYEIELIAGCSIVETARNIAAHNFLKGEWTHLFFLDSDITWDVNDFWKLVAIAERLDICCAAYRTKDDEPKYMTKGIEVSSVGDSLGCYETSGTGAGFLCVKRHVLQTLSIASPRVFYPNSNGYMSRIFRCRDDGQRFIGEDIGFFADARRLGFKAHLEPNVILGHVGPKEYKGCIAENLAKINELAEKSLCSASA